MTFMGECAEVTARTVSEWAEAGQHGDAEAAFRLATYGFAHDRRKTAEEWMARGTLRQPGDASVAGLYSRDGGDRCGVAGCQVYLGPVGVGADAGFEARQAAVLRDPVAGV